MESLREFLRLEYSEENLEFWMECEAFKQAHARHVRPPTAVPSAPPRITWFVSDQSVSALPIANCPGAPALNATDAQPATADSPKPASLNGSATRSLSSSADTSVALSSPPSSPRAAQPDAVAPECVECGGECGSCSECARLATEIVERFLSPSSPKEVPLGRVRRI